MLLKIHLFKQVSILLQTPHTIIRPRQIQPHDFMRITRAAFYCGDREILDSYEVKARKEPAIYPPLVELIRQSPNPAFIAAVHQKQGLQTARPVPQEVVYHPPLAVYRPPNTESEPRPLGSGTFKTTAL